MTTYSSHYIVLGLYASPVYISCGKVAVWRRARFNSSLDHLSNACTFLLEGYMTRRFSACHAPIHRLSTPFV
ncbi:hypothetical protein BD309DRAFT_974192 [Dichomitus squalens]|nr:hypothetical protein BD309DRAFT_974192 [Dichomitus squalens]